MQMLPKAELHCHSEGVVDPEMLTQLRSADHALGVSPEELAATLPVDSFDSWIQGYSKVIEPALMSSEYELARRTFGLTDADFAKIYQDTLQARFAGRRSGKVAC
jgi:hypothetical protein